MKPLSVGRFPRGSLLPAVILLLVGLCLAQPSLPSLAHASPPTSGCCGLPTYLGAYLPDGKFRANSRSSKQEVSLAPVYSPQEGIRPAELPGFVNLHPVERVVEDYQPPARATKPAQRRFFLSGLRDDLLTLVYGREQALVAPQRLTVDSRGRVIVSDPGLGAVHVLDGKNSFRIVAGANRRLHMPIGVAVDRDDNIYVTDSDRGLVVVFDRNGSFLRDIGRVGNESFFHEPTAIAIDRHSDRMYVLDSGREALFVIDLQGNILQRVGRSRGLPIGRFSKPSCPLDLSRPTELALGNDRIAVLDKGNSRVRVLNLQCEILTEFNLTVPSNRQPARQIGLGMDSAGNVYVSNTRDSAVSVYDERGHHVTSFKYGAKEELTGPSPLWLDSADRIYIADTDHRQIRVFQMSLSAQ